MGATKESTQRKFPLVDPSKHKIKSLIAACLAIAVREFFKSHVYTFGAKLSKQVKWVNDFFLKQTVYSFFVFYITAYENLMDVIPNLCLQISIFDLFQEN